MKALIKKLKYQWNQPCTHNVVNLGQLSICTFRTDPIVYGYNYVI